MPLNAKFIIGFTIFKPDKYYYLSGFINLNNMHLAIFCLLGGALRYVFQVARSLIKGVEKPSYSATCKHPGNAWLGLIVVFPLLLLIFLITNW